MNRRLRARVTGYVQGVSFRYYARQEARRLGLCGWIANQADGSVEVVAEGPEKDIGTFSQFLLSGSPHAHVDHVEVDWLDATNEFTDFSIHY